MHDTAAMTRLGDALRAGVTDLAQLTPERLLDVSAADVAMARQDGEATHPDVPREFSTMRYRQGLRLHRGYRSRVAVVAPSRTGISRIADALTAPVAERGICLLLEMMHTPMDPELCASAPEGWVRLAIRSRLTDQVRLPSLGFRGQLAWDATGNETPEAGVAVVRMDDVPVAWVMPDRRTVRLLVNPLVSRDGSAFSSAQLERRVGLLLGLLDAVLPHCTGAWREGGDEQTDRAALRAQVGALDAVLALAGAGALDMRNEAEALTGRVAQSQARARSARDELVGALRARREAETAIRQSRTDREGRYAQAIGNAIAEIDRIRSLRPVRSCEVVERGGSFWLDVTLHDYVMQHHGRTERRLLTNLDFRLGITGRSQGHLAWGLPERESRSPHPHVSTSGATCWGEAAGPVHEAVRSAQWSTVVSLICGWATQHNPRSEYVRFVESFPISDRPAGWIVPGEEAPAPEASAE